MVVINVRRLNELTATARALSLLLRKQILKLL
jgi:hypothetical protein